MKKLLLLATLLLLVVSCTTEIDQQFGKMRAGAPGAKVVFQASVEECTAPETKVYADESMKVLWNADDRISIFNQSTYNWQFAFEGDDGDTAGGFEPVGEGEPGSEMENVYAVYPYKAETALSTAGVLTTVLPAEQAYKAHSFGIGANTMVAVTGDNFLAFKNVGGYLSLRLYGDNISVRRITLKSNGGEKIAGEASITMPLGGLPEVTVAGSGTDAISLVCDPAVKLGRSETSYTEFWLVVPPVTMAGGFEITVVDDMGGVYTKKTTKSYTVTRNTLDWMKELKVEPDYDNVGIEFDDDNFEAFCLSNYDSNHDGVVTGAEVENIKVVNVSTDNIRSIKGIEFFASLEQLTCRGSLMQTKSAMQTKSGSYGGQLETIDVSKNVHLWELDCSGNKLEEVDVSNNPNLQTLICNDNPIDEVILAPDQVIATLESPVTSNVVYEWEDADVPAADEIWYTTSNGALVTPRDDASFGDVTIVSNTYVDGKGVLKFSGPLKTIGTSAFGLAEGHDYLTSVTLPEGLTTIEGYAFGYCQAMVSITFPSTLTSLGFHAIRDCYSLTYVTLPESLTDLSDACFDNCRSLKGFQGPYASADHKCLIKDGRLIAIAIPYGSSPSFTIPSGVTDIGDYVFHFRGDFTEITIPEGVKTIGHSFSACTSLTSITIPESVTNIGTGAFTECTSLQEFNGTFASDDHRCLVVNGTTVGFAPAGLTSYTIPSVVTNVAYSTFERCYELTSVTIPESVTQIGEYAFSYCSALTSVIMESSTPPVLMGNRIFNNTNNCPIYVPADAVDIYKAASRWSAYADRIQAMSGAVPANFPDENFRAYIFENFDSDKDGKLSSAECDAVTRMTVDPVLVASLEGIEYFKNLQSLTCSLNWDNGRTIDGVMHFYNEAGEEIFASLTSLDLSGNTELTYLDCCSLTFTSLDVSKNTALQTLWCGFNQLTSLDVSKNTSLTHLECHCNQLTSLDVSNNSALMELYCFSNQLTGLDVSKNTSLTYLSCGDNHLTSLDVSNNTSLSSLDCRNNSNLATLYLATGQGIETLEKDSGTEIVYIGSGPATNEIWYTTTDGAVLEPEHTDVFGDVTITSNTYENGKGVITFSGPVTILDTYAFWDASRLVTISIPESVDRFGYGTFTNCHNLRSISSKYATSDGRAIVSSDTLKAFAPAGLTSYAIPDGVKTIEYYTFNDFSALTDVTLPDGLLSICGAAFSGTGLTTVDIPQSVTSIDGQSFFLCNDLESFTGKFATDDGRALVVNGKMVAFAPAGLTSYSVPEGVTRIERFVIGSTQLLSVTLPQSLSSLDWRAVNYCPALSEITVKATTPPTGHNNMFSSTNDCPIYVPSASLDAYKTAQYWSSYADRIQPAAPLPTVVDLGLSVKWASCNLGASSPEGYGDYYAWGETAPKQTYTRENYAWCMGAERTLTKYCYDSAYGYQGFVDDKRILELADDAAYANLGAGYRTPTCGDWKELFENTSQEWTNNYQGSGVSGYILTSTVAGYTNHSIFLPCLGFGAYMSSEQLNSDPEGFDIMGLSEDSIYGCNYMYRCSCWYRYEGTPVRPVYDN